MSVYERRIIDTSGVPRTREVQAEEACACGCDGEPSICESVNGKKFCYARLECYYRVRERREVSVS